MCLNKKVYFRINVYTDGESPKLPLVESVSDLPKTVHRAQTHRSRWARVVIESEARPATVQLKETIVDKPLVKRSIMIISNQIGSKMHFNNGKPAGPGSTLFSKGGMGFRKQKFSVVMRGTRGWGVQGVQTPSRKITKLQGCLAILVQLPWKITKLLSQHSLLGLHRPASATPFKVSTGAKIRNRYNQVPHLTQDTNGKVTNSQTPQTRTKRSALSQQVTTYKQTRTKT